MSRPYVLVTGNRAYVDFWNENPIIVTGARVAAEFDDFGEVGDAHVKLVRPDGADLDILQISLQAPATIKGLIQQDLEAVGSGSGNAGEVQPLICVWQIPSGAAFVTLWRSGVEFVSPGTGAADETACINPGPESHQQLKQLVDEWRERYGARVDSEIPLEDPVGEVAAAVEPARRAPTQAVEAARAEHQLGQDLNGGAQSDPGHELRELPIREIQHFPGGNQREVFRGLEELAESIRSIGIIQPLTVNELDGRFTLIAGERRLRAAGLARRDSVPCRVLHLSEEQALEAMLVENIQREDLSPMEEARAYKRLLAFVGATQVSVAKRVGRSQQHVNEYLQLLDLPADLQHQVAVRSLPVQAALVFLRRTRNLPDTVRDHVGKALTQKQPSLREAPAVIEAALAEVGAQGTARAVPPREEKKAPAAPEPASSSSQAPPPAAAAPAPATAPAQQIQPEASAEQAPPAPPEEPAPRPESQPVHPSMERSRQLRQLGLEHWPALNEGVEAVIDREYLPSLAQVLENWQARLGLKAAHLPRALGQVEIHIPEHRVLIRGRDTTEVKMAAAYRPEDLPIIIDGTVLTVRCTGGRVEGAYVGSPVYYRAAVYSTGTNRYMRQQLVIQDGGRHLVINGLSPLNMQADQVPDLDAILQQLPALA